MVGHNGDEGLGYPILQNNTAFEGEVYTDKTHIASLSL